MLYLWLILLILINAVWLVLTFFALPGNWLIIITASLFAWWRADDNVFSVYTLLAIAILALAGELIEFFSGAGGAKRAGAGWRGSIGAIIGAVTGAVLGTFLLPLPLLGTLIGACVGAGLGALCFELSAGRQVKEALNLGFGAGVGQLVGATAKVTIGVLIWLIITAAAFWP